MNKISEAAKERSRRQREADPDHFKKLGKIARSKVKRAYYHFKELKKQDPKKLEQISYRGGKKPTSPEKY